MPVMPFQAKIAKLLSVNRNPESFLAGGAALHFEPMEEFFRSLNETREYLLAQGAACACLKKTISSRHKMLRLFRF